MAVADGVRAAGRADIAAVLTLWERARSAAASTPDTPETVARLLTTGPGSLLVAERGPDGAIVGALIAAWDGWRGNMYRLAVDPAHRRAALIYQNPQRDRERAIADAVSATVTAEHAVRTQT